MARNKPHRALRKARLLAGLFIGAPLLALPTAQAEWPVASASRTCELIDERLQSVDKEDCRRTPLKTGDGASRNGLPLFYADFPAAYTGKRAQRVLLIGGIHGDELSSISVVFQWMRRLQRGDGAAFQWRVMPAANPDGLLAKTSQRTNRNGVDLNRNFASRDWDKLAMDYWHRRTGSDVRRYPGPSAESEPETRWIVQQIRQYKPDVIVSVHAPYNVLDYDGPPEPPKRFGYLERRTLGVYPGSLGNFAGVDLGLPVVTLELPSAGAMPNAAEADKVWNDMLAWFTQNLPRSAPVFSLTPVYAAD